METVTARLPEDMLKVIEELARASMVDRSELIRRLLEIGIRRMLLERALEAYRKRRVSLWKAAEMAKVTLREMIEAADKAMIPVSYDVKDLERDFELARRGAGRK